MNTSAKVGIAAAVLVPIGVLALVLLLMVSSAAEGAAEHAKDTTQTTAGGGPASVPGIPAVMLQAYERGAARASGLRPTCRGLRWQILAGLGAIESDHGLTQLGLKSGQHRTTAPNGQINPPIIGPVLDGHGVQLVRDTDHGRYDGDTRYDHAVGPMQFLPGTWATEGQDGNGDGVADPNNAFDAATTAGTYLCGTSALDLSDQTVLDRRIMIYNHSAAYVRDVTAKIDQYDPYGDSPQAAAAGATGGRAQILKRAATWVSARIPYSQGAYHDGYRTDCSGFVSMAWGLGTPGLTTVSLPQQSHRISAGQLQPGDVLLNTQPGSAGHVTIFDRWANADHTSYWAYEEAGSLGAVHRTIRYPYDFGGQNYQPYRFNQLGT
ncbi:hypothetical protein BIV57_13550 [Mangrovactinospora gilvigrisea]|uniref:NlpC/P60 domain-containing protein n=1 Tax=Mangrovactinospora gilvigrisea TaxID=1428644 RepID=A0A1J7C625_9ACTN|nr:lytic transglycosylase domain-containing protein [Mangrovactinospora gilvigrisea]OIV37008.1 hypothetical protein BIV57_13550 [Mangrovactinospora gilvigrisea]